jgi:hypothetical protein
MNLSRSYNRSMMILVVGLVASFQTTFDSLQWNSIRICNNCGLVSAKAMTKARSEFRDIRHLDAPVIGCRPASPIQYSTCIQHAERTQSISGPMKCARFHDKAKRQKVSGIRLGCGREDGTLRRYLNRHLMVLALLGELLSNNFQSVQWNLMRI